MEKRKRSVGELISSVTFLVFGIWVIAEGTKLWVAGDIVKSVIVFICGILSFAGAFRFQIKRLVDNWFD